VRGTKRITYIIDPEGKIAQAYPEVDPANHALQLLADVKKLKKNFKVA
jgi:peroxiredoxin Q/BCP